MTKLQVLERYFGYPSFRPGQEELIDALLQGRDAVGIMPTGAGKSLCFQVPALLMPGITLVVSPLISLMQDQVAALVQNGVRGAYLNSSLTPGQYRAALRNARAGVYKIIYVAPERLLTPDFLDFALGADISMVTIDEAHCVSQWGQDFRPSYLKIPEFIAKLPRRPVVSAFTATATPRVREDILALLALEDPYVALTGFDRPNLYWEVRKPRNKLAALLEILEERKGRSGIVYCSTRKAVEEVCLQLREHGYAAAQYHAGMEDRERHRQQEDFLYDRAEVMVATNAFGMGIDKSNVSFVVHYNMPKDVESYYQEAGRAGRDGSPADCILLYSGQDVVLQRLLFTRGDEAQALEEEDRARLLEQNEERLKAMTFYCHTDGCLRAYLLRYFGEHPKSSCGNCWNCLHLSRREDIFRPAREMAVCVRHLQGRYGMKLVLEVLRGSRSQRIRQLGFHKYPSYGKLADYSEDQLRDIANYLVAEDYLALSGSEYPLLTPGKRIDRLLTGKGPLWRRQGDQASPPSRDKKPQGPGDPELLRRLRSLRNKLAAQQNVPAYVVFSNAALEDMSARQPADEEELLQVSGVGQAKLQRYGREFLREIAAWKAEQG